MRQLYAFALSALIAHPSLAGSVGSPKDAAMSLILVQARTMFASTYCDRTKFNYAEFDHYVKIFAITPAELRSRQSYFTEIFSDSRKRFAADGKGYCNHLISYFGPNGEIPNIIIHEAG